ncbi:MAG: hypothetical protein ABR981_01535 [Candidatus Micrarchaeaceae archaeon]
MTTKIGSRLSTAAKERLCETFGKYLNKRDPDMGHTAADFIINSMLDSKILQNQTLTNKFVEIVTKNYGSYPEAAMNLSVPLDNDVYNMGEKEFDNYLFIISSPNFLTGLISFENMSNVIHHFSERMAFRAADKATDAKDELYAVLDSLKDPNVISLVHGIIGSPAEDGVLEIISYALQYGIEPTKKVGEILTIMKDTPRAVEAIRKISDEFAKYVADDVKAKSENMGLSRK